PFRDGFGSGHVRRAREQRLQSRRVMRRLLGALLIAGIVSTSLLASAARHEPTTRLQVACDPWCMVTLDGKSIGATPILGHRVAPGTHQVKLENDNVGFSHERKVTIADGVTLGLKADVRSGRI